MNTYCNASCKEFALLAYEINSKIKLPLQDRSKAKVSDTRLHNIWNK